MRSVYCIQLVVHLFCMPAAAIVFTLFLVDTIISWNKTTLSALVVIKAGTVSHVYRVTVTLAALTL